MKRSVLFALCLFLSTHEYVLAQVAISTDGSAPDPKAMLEIKSSTSGFLPPRMSNAEIHAIAPPIPVGLQIFNTTTNCLNFYDGLIWRVVCGDLPDALITGLDCNNASQSGSLLVGGEANGVTVTVPYSGGNGGTYGTSTASSTGVTGLVATLSPGTLAVGIGTVTFTITGTPSGQGTATFALSLGGQSCSVGLNATGACQGVTSVNVTYNGNTTAYGTVESLGQCWLDRNLGASQVATSKDDAAAIGGYIQWGRQADGHQFLNAAQTTSLSNSDNPGTSSFIRAPSSPYDWRSPQNDNLWQGVSGVNNPCPAGWRVPSLAELEVQRQSWATNDATGAFNSPLKWAKGACREGSGNSSDASQAVYCGGDAGAVWSTTVSDGDPIRIVAMRIDNNPAYSGPNIFYRASGLPVRCIKD